MILLIELLAACIFGYLYVSYGARFWKRNKVPYIKAVPPFGNLADLVFLKKSSSELMIDLYNHQDAVNHPLVGFHIFHKPALLIRDPGLIKKILVKDFECFTNRYSKISNRIDSLGANILFFLKNPIWRKLRTINTPMFTSAKMKSTFPLLVEVGEKLNTRLTALVKSKSICYEVDSLSFLFTADAIASVAFNVHANSIEDPMCPFNSITAKILEFNYLRSFSLAIAFFIPSLSRFVRARFFPKIVAKFLKSIIVKVIADREITGLRRNDVIDNLIHVRNSMKSKVDENGFIYDGDVLYAQAAAFYTAGYGTTASALSFSLLELAKHVEYQKRLRKEIHDILLQYKGKICYEAVAKMEYLNMVIHEALRLYPTLPFLDRECTLSKGQTHYSLEPYSSFKIPNGMPVYIPAYALHKDPKFFPDPDEFKPERFSSEHKKNILDYTYIPFGLGPRNCVGGRLGLLLVKIGLVYFLLNHRLEANEKTPQVIKFEKRAMIIKAEGGLYCDIIYDPLFK